MKTIIGIVIILAIKVAVTALAGSTDPQIITLDDGTKLTLLGVTYGSHHVAPHFEDIGGETGMGNWIYTQSNSTVVWIEAEHKPGTWPSYELLVYDEAKTACVPVEKATSSHVKDGVDVQGFVLKAFPRWQNEVTLRAVPYRGRIADGQFVINNPQVGSFLTWTPTPLPNQQSDDDLEVTLTKLTTGAPLPYWQGQKPTPTNDVAMQCVHLNFDFRQNGQPTTNWFPWLVWTTDAYGNQVESAIRDYPRGGVAVYPPHSWNQDGYYYQPGLWPDEPAWKVRLEFTRRSGFDDDEIVMFTNIPVKTGDQQDFNREWTWNEDNDDFTFTPATVNGVHLKLLPPLLIDNRWQSSEKDISIIIGADPGFNPKGMNLTVVAATDDQGRKLWSFEKPPWAGHYSIEFARVHDDIKSLNLSLALHRSRFVEFTVKPTKE